LTDIGEELGECGVGIIAEMMANAVGVERDGG